MTRTSCKSSPRRILVFALLVLALFGCTPRAEISPPESPTAPPRLETVAGLSAEEMRTLASLEMVDDYPLYVMHFYASYDLNDSVPVPEDLHHDSGAFECCEPWACSLFTALSDETNMLFGRNFDWDFSPAMLLFTHPSQGYASVSVVDIAYFGFGGARAGNLMDLSLAERSALLQAPLLPFDGMNERGLTIGMAEVPPGDMVPDPQKETIGSVRVIRMILDQAADVDEALSIMRNHNIDMSGGPPLHYLIADRKGRSALVEFYRGEMVVIDNHEPWHLATNFLRSEAAGSDEGFCWRYDTIYQRLESTAGKISTQQAMDLLQDVSVAGTQWSVVYGMSTGEILISMGRQYEERHSFNLPTP
ncbi:MAG: linear amide C-N hydrolase [Anaerolineales bacterium]|nr:linear amide C-N hydrolase [Anaerolineales bacterium]